MAFVLHFTKRKQFKGVAALALGYKPDPTGMPDTMSEVVRPVIEIEDPPTWATDSAGRIDTGVN